MDPLEQEIASKAELSGSSQIPARLELLSVDQIKQSLESNHKHLVLEVVKTIDSTNSYLLSSHLNENYVACIAEQQTAGRGRRGRQWASPFGCNLYLSLAWLVPAAANRIAGLSIVVAIAVVEVLTELGYLDIKIKWPNDIIYQNKKLGGILIDVNGEALGPCRAVIGLGLNVDLSDNQAAEIDQAWIDLYRINSQPISRNRLAGLILNKLLLNLPQFLENGVAAYLTQWQRFDALSQQDVKLSTAQGCIQGIGQGITLQGELILKINGQLMNFHSGEASIIKT